MLFYPLLLTGDRLFSLSALVNISMGPIFFPRETLTGFLATKCDDVLMNDIMAFSKMNNGPGPHPVQVEMHSQAVSLTTPQSLTFNSDLVIFFFLL